ncbi:MAG: CehA/McbA family metallohydrolase [Chloroflexia bacterium]
MRLYDYPGAFHVHSSHSDGTGPVPKIALAAQRAGLTWVVISDHDTLAALEAREAGWYDGTAVLIGYEVTPEHNHFLVLGLSELVPADLPAQELVAAVRERGGWGFILHPDERLGAYFKAPLPWTERDVRGFHGLEIWNYMSLWTEGVTRRNQFARFLFPGPAVCRPPRASLEWWDELLREGQRVAAVAGLDAHATRISLRGRLQLEVFSYRRLFGTLLNHVVLRKPLSQEWNEAAQQIESALAEGRSFLAYQVWGKARGFRFLAEQEAQSWTMGEEAVLRHEARLRVHSPRWGYIRLLRYGKPIAQGWGRTLTCFVQEPGAYRAEVYRFGFPWIYSNPIYLVRGVARPQEPPRVASRRRPWER